MHESRSAYPLNVSGPFYVVNDCCTACMAPHGEAPALMGFDEGKGHCFIKEQPRTKEEVYRALRAVRSSEFECLRYAGHDPDVLRRLAEAGMPHVCDHAPPSSLTRLLRNHVTFEAIQELQPSELAELLRQYLLGQNDQYHRNNQYKMTPAKQDNRGVSFAFAWAEDHYHPVLVGQGEPETGRWLVTHSPVEKLGSQAVSLIIDDWLRAGGRFRAIRWYTAHMWGGSKAEWQETPI